MKRGRRKQSGLVNIFWHALWRYLPADLADLHKCKALNTWGCQSICQWQQCHKTPSCRSAQARRPFHPAVLKKRALLARAPPWPRLGLWMEGKANIDPPRCPTCSPVAGASPRGRSRCAESRWCFLSVNKQNKTACLRNNIVASTFSRQPNQHLWRAGPPEPRIS